jgi:hypothetical protein
MDGTWATGQHLILAVEDRGLKPLGSGHGKTGSVIRRLVGKKRTESQEPGEPAGDGWRGNALRYSILIKYPGYQIAESYTLHCSQLCT